MTARMTAKEFRKAVAAKPAKKPWSNAKRTTCGRGHLHASKLEARCCDHLTAACALPGTDRRLYQQVRLPLWSLAPDSRGRPAYMTVDFGIAVGTRLVRLVDAKGRRDKTWRDRRGAIEAAYGIRIEEWRQK